MAKEYSAAEKLAAAKQLEDARQHVRELGSAATLTDRRSVTKAEKHYNKVMGR